MNAERLLSRYDQFVDTPDAVPRLRRFVLDLAVQGKLVEQNTNDEPASELLKRIAAEKVRLVKARKIKKLTTLPETVEQIYDLPSSWIWTPIRKITGATAAGTVPDNSVSRWFDFDRNQTSSRCDHLRNSEDSSGAFEASESRRRVDLRRRR